LFDTTSTYIAEAQKFSGIITALVHSSKENSKLSSLSSLGTPGLVASLSIEGTYLASTSSFEGSDKHTASGGKEALIAALEAIVFSRGALSRRDT
jgi:hypothetical protein